MSTFAAIDAVGVGASVSVCMAWVRRDLGLGEAQQVVTLCTAVILERWTSLNVWSADTVRCGVVQDSALSCHPFNMQRLTDDLQRVFPQSASTGSGDDGVDDYHRQVLLLHLIDIASNDAAWSRLTRCVLKALDKDANQSGGMDQHHNDDVDISVDVSPSGRHSSGDAEDARIDALHSHKAALTLKRLFVASLPPPVVSTSAMLFGYGLTSVLACDC